MDGVRVYVGTTDGVFRLASDGKAVEPLGVRGERVWALAAWAAPAGDVVLAGTYGAGIYRSADGGASWAPASQGLTAPFLRSLQPDPLRAGVVHAGAEPGRLFRSDDDGQTWREVTSFTDVPGSADWFLPYSPRAGAVRNVLLPADRPDTLAASVEVGGALLSDDGGARWRYIIGPNEDVHFITADPAIPGRLYAAMGYAGLSTGGVLRSDDGGRSWRRIIEGYTRAIVAPPGQANALLASPGPHVGREAQIKLTRDGGETWLDATTGITTPMPDMVEVFHADPTGRISGAFARADASSTPTPPTGTGARYPPSRGSCKPNRSPSPGRAALALQPGDRAGY